MQNAPPFYIFRTTGMALLFSVCVLATFPGCGGSNQAPTGETKKFLPADSSAAAASSASQTSGGTSASNPLVISNEFAPAGSGQSAPATKSGAASANRDATAPGPQGVQIAGDLKAILEQIDRLGSQQPRGATPQEQREDYVRTHNQRLTLAKKALTMNPPIEVKRVLVMAIYEVLQRFIEAGVPSAPQQIIDFAKSMTPDPDPEIARIGRHSQFTANLTRLVSDQNNVGGVNSKEIVAEAKKLLTAEKGNLSEDTLQLVGQTADMLTSGGFTADAGDLIETIAATLSADPKLADQAPRYALVAKVVKMDLDTLMNNVFKGEAGADEKIDAALKTLLTDIPPSRDLLNRAQTVAHILEATGHYQSALAAYDKIAERFANSSDQSLADQAKDIAPAAKLRIGLVGQPFTVEGVTIDGTPLDWSAYAGKVTLVDFWATWCGPCLEEMPNVRQNFEQFHSKGFEVVGVNMDTRVNDIKQFLTLQGSDIPWVTVTSQIVLDGKVTDGDWSKLPMAAKCGVQSIPFIVLVGRDGKVDSIHVRGPKLKKRLTELLGEPATADIPSDPTQQANPPAVPSATRPTNGKQSRAVPSGSSGTTFSMFVTAALLAADEPAASAAEDDKINPYLAKPGLSTKDLVAYIQKMLDRPLAIQTRDGFTAGIVDACDRILAANSTAAEPSATDADRLFATQSKLDVLHRDACDGKKSADQELIAFVDQLKDDVRPAIAKEVAFFRLERRVLTAKEAPLTDVPAALDAVKEFAAQEKLSAKHLRLASGTVALINRLESETERESRFAELGELFAQSPDKDLSRYGRKIAKTSATK
jgi:thiol-disulfide isomerase/thioredoxin